MGLQVPVLWIRIRSDPKLFAGSGSDELQFLMTKIRDTIKSAETPLVIENFTVRTVIL